MNCPNCHQEVADSTRYCPYCGACLLARPSDYDIFISVVMGIFALPMAVAGSCYLVLGSPIFLKELAKGPADFDLIKAFFSLLPGATFLTSAIFCLCYLVKLMIKK